MNRERSYDVCGFVSILKTGESGVVLDCTTRVSDSEIFKAEGVFLLPEGVCYLPENDQVTSFRCSLNNRVRKVSDGAKHFGVDNEMMVVLGHLASRVASKWADIGISLYSDSQSSLPGVLADVLSTQLRFLDLAKTHDDKFLSHKFLADCPNIRNFGVEE